MRKLVFRGILAFMGLLALFFISDAMTGLQNRSDPDINRMEIELGISLMLIMVLVILLVVKVDHDEEAADIVGGLAGRGEPVVQTGVLSNTARSDEEEVLYLVDRVRNKLRAVKKGSVEKDEIENLLRLAESFAGMKRFDKALAFARQAHKKAVELTGSVF